MTRYREHMDKINPAIPYIALYDANGGQTINGSFLTWDGIKCKTSHFTYEEDDDRVQLSVNSSGLFEVIFNVSLSGNGNNYFEIYKNNSVVSESRVYVCPPTVNQSAYYDSGSIHYVVFLQKDDYIQIKGTCAAGSGETIANTCRLTIKFLPMKGWDNNIAGRTSYKGGVMR